MRASFSLVINLKQPLMFLGPSLQDSQFCRRILQQELDLQLGLIAKRTFLMDSFVGQGRIIFKPSLLLLVLVVRYYRMVL